MWFTRTLKKTDLCWLILIIGLFVFLPSKVFAAGEPCWKDYPTGGTAIAGFPTAADFTLPGTCKPADQCSPNIKGPGGFGCKDPEICCLIPAKPLGCFNDYVGADRTSFQSASCLEPTACTSGNKPIAPAGQNGCTGTKVCCAIIKAGTSAAKGTGGTVPQTGSTAAWVSSVPGGLVLVPCTQSGNCTIDDLVNQGINFAKWIMGLAGALFLLVFVYGGAMYVASFGKSDYVTKGKKALTRGAIGIVLVMGAWTIVSYVATSLGYAGVGVGGSGGGSKGICGQATGTEGRTCMDTNAAGKGKDCLQSYCPGAASIQCCK
ncbi:MAG: pilin [Patescibacteria group bacterium]|nr:pilin [Patescibacteria group bacterium]